MTDDDDDREAGVRIANRMLVKAGVDATIADVGSRYRLTYGGETYEFAGLGRLLQWVYEHCEHSLDD